MKRSRSGRDVWGCEESMELHRSEKYSVGHGSFVSASFCACFAHEGDIRQKVLRLKYQTDKSLARELSQHLVAAIAEVGAIDVVTWAPTSSARRQQRGFDHGELLARHAATTLQMKCRCLLRRANNEHQTGRSRHVRLAQPEFVARPLGAMRKICVIDDVMTTGATFRAAVSALARRGATDVLCVAVTYVPDIHDS